VSGDLDDLLPDHHSGQQRELHCLRQTCLVDRMRDTILQKGVQALVGQDQQ
jgi:hypothetical protein